jgi:hypothetical protein
MSDAQTVPYLTADCYITKPDVTLEDLAGQRGIPAEQLLTCNPGIKKQDVISFRTIQMPRFFESVGEKVNYDIFEPELAKNRPCICEAIDMLRNLDIAARQAGASAEKKIIVTHVDAYEKSRDEFEKPFGLDTSCGWTKYRKKILDEYYDTLCKFGVFHTRMVYLYHLVCNTRYCKITDTEKILPAVKYTAGYLQRLLTRLNDTVSFVSLNYQSLTGACGDFVLYQNITDFLKEELPYMSTAFRDGSDIAGVMTVKKLYRNFFEDFQPGVLFLFSKAVSDDMIFDYGKDYSGMTDKLTDLRDNLKKGYQTALKQIHEQSETRSSEAVQLWSVFHIKEIKTYISSLEQSITAIKKQSPKFAGAFNPGCLEKMGSSLEQAVRQAEEKGRAAAGSSGLHESLSLLDERLAVYNTAAAVYYRASAIYKLDPVTKLVSEDEVLYKQAQTFFDELNRADRAKDTDTIQNCLQHVYRLFPGFCTDTDKLQKRKKQVETAEKAVLLVLAVAAIAAVTVATAGAAAAPSAALLAGGSGGIMTGLTTSQAVIVMVTESYAWASAGEALGALTEDRNISFINVMSGFITNLMFEGIFRYINVRFTMPAAAAGETVGASEAVLYSFKKAAVLAAGSFVGSVPGFIFRIGMTYQRLPDMQTWGNFLIVDAITSCCFSSLSVLIENAPQIIGQVKKLTVKARMTKELNSIHATMTKTQKLYRDVNEKYGTTVKFDKNTYDELVNRNKTVVENLQQINKSLKALRRLLIEEQVRHSFASFRIFAEKYAGLQVIDDLLDGIQKILEKAVFREPPRYGLAVEIDKMMGSGKGLLQLDASKGLYLANNEALLARQQDIEGLLKNYSVEIGYKLYEGQAERCKGTLLMTIADKESGELVDSVTVLDIAGKGMAEHALQMPRQIRTSESTIPPSMLHVVSGFREYQTLNAKSAEEIIAAVKAHDTNTALANMSEDERIHLRELLRNYHIQPTLVVRIDGGNWPFSQPSVIYVFDIIEFMNQWSRKNGIIKIGYGLKEILEMDRTPQPVKYLRIFKLDKDAACLLPSNTDSLKLEFRDMVRRAKYIKKGGPHDPGFKCADMYSYDQIDDFGRWLEKMSTLLRKRYGSLTEDGVRIKIEALIDKVNTPPFTDTWSPGSYCVDSLSDPEKPDRIRVMEDKYTDKELAYNEEYQVLKMCNDYLSTYGQFWNNGYTLTVLGNRGYGEYHLVTVYDEKKAALKQNGYTEIGTVLLSTFLPEE